MLIKAIQQGVDISKNLNGSLQKFLRDIEILYRGFAKELPVCNKMLWDFLVVYQHTR